MKQELQASGASRREFLRDSLRYTLLGGVAAAAGTLAVRSAGQECVNDGLCRGCIAYDDCGLPRALSVKQASEKRPYS